VKRSFHAGSRWFAVAIALLAVIAVAGAYFTATMSEYGRREVSLQSRTALSVVSTYLENEIEALNSAVAAMAGSPWIFPALTAPSSLNLAHANSVLDRYHKAMRASVSYLLDARGIVVASSNRGETDSFVGQFYGFRPYFREAFKGNLHRYFAFGVTSRKKGFYTSAPVRSPSGSVVGVAVMKKDLDDAEAFMSKYAKCLFINPQGVVFLSSRPEFSLKSAWPLTEKERQELVASAQLGPGPFEPLLTRRAVDGSSVVLDDEELLVSKKDFGADGWSLMVMFPLRAIAMYRSIGIMATVFLFMITAGLFALLYTREKSALRIRQSEERFKQLTENSRDWIWEVDAHVRFTYSSCAVTDILGYTAAELIGKPFIELIVAEDRESVSRRIGEIFNRGEVIRRNRNRYLHRDGRKVILEVSGLPMTDDEGKIIGYRGLSRDITAQLQTLAALRASEESFRSMTETAQDAIIIMDDEGSVVYWNRAAEKILGYRREEVSGKNLHELIAPPRFHEAHRAAMPIFRATGEGAAMGKTLELAALHRDGSEFPIALSLSAVKIKNRWTALGILRDISAHKQAEEALRKAKHEAEAASRMKSEFLAGMSHEIRTPMNAIIGMADLLLDTTLTRDQQKYVNVLRNAGEHLLELINEILDLSKVEAGRLQLETALFNLTDMVERTCEEMAVRAHGKGLELTCRLEPDVPRLLEGDPVRLKQILMNLLGNAVKFTEQGCICVDIRRSATAETAAGTVEILFSVTDTGIGIPADKQELIFDKFTQVDASITRKYGGTGLGLAISRRLVELMGGAIWLESEEGRGSAFRFTARFPVREGAAAEPSGELPVNSRRLRVIVVDDNEMNRLILYETLNIWGIESISVESGRRCLEEMRRSREEGRPFHLVLLDYQMPEMDGLEVAARIRGDVDLAETPIIMLTSGFQKEDLERAARLRVLNYLYKPVKRAELKEAIANVAAGAARIHEEPPPDGEAPRPVETGRAAGPPLRILLADDNEDNRLLIWTYFKASPHRIDMAEDGREALDKFQENRYDLVLMDMQMPVMDGYTSTAAIRTWERAQGLKPTPILALTAHALKEDEQKSLDAGCDGHLIKPIKKRQLLDAVARWTAGNRE